MRRAFVPTALTAALALVPWIGVAQGQAMDASKAVAGGGISVPGWMGQVDPSQSRRGLTVESAKLTKEGDALHIVTGPESAKRLPNRACALAALAMRASFANGDLVGGIVTGLRMLADAAGTR